jgi:hypothetical protein
MATNTTRWALRKPAAGDTINPATDLGGPYDIIDAALGSTVCTSSTRPGSPVIGQTIFETDTRRTYVYAGSSVWLPIGPLTAVKTTDKTVASSVTMSDDTQLVLPVLASTTYLLQAYLIYSSATAADAKIGLTVPASATWQLSPFALTAAVAATSGSLETAVSTASGITVGGNGVGVKVAASVMGTLVVGATAGTAAVSFAQLVSTASNTVLHTGSWLQLMRV